MEVCIGDESLSVRTFSSLPVEMVRHCFGFLTAKELCKINLVCGKWLGIAESMDNYWKELLKLYIPRGLRLSSSDSFLQNSELSWKNKYRMLTTTSMKDIKFVFVGDSRVGKTNLIHKYLNFKYNSYIPTIHDTYSTRISSGDHVHNISMWDTSGDEEYDRLRPLSYMKSDVACLVFSHDDYHSFKNIAAKWHPELRSYIPDATIVLVGIKSTTSIPRREIDPADIKAMLKLKGIVGYVECDVSSELCLNTVLEEGLSETFKKANKRRRTFLSLFKRKKDKVQAETAPVIVKHLHYGVHNSHVGKNVDTGFEEMWMLTQAPNRVTTVLYVAY